jgi:hypothetical protein
MRKVDKKEKKLKTFTGDPSVISCYKYGPIPSYLGRTILPLVTKKRITKKQLPLLYMTS